jgi:FMNH2-dependent dimethyl sulfone monooxygenase
LKPKLGIYVPVYKGWVPGVDEGEDDPTFKYAAETVIRAEKIGIHSIWVPDHFLNPIKGEHEKSLEAWTTLTALAAITRKVELFHTTLCQAFRYPAILAKMCATLDDVSRGRFRFVLGAGWFEREFKAYGVPWHDHDSRIDRSREQLEIIKSLWTKPLTNYRGQFYEITDGVLEPKPIQKPHPPIWWGGQSEKSRELAADLADGWLVDSCSVREAKQKADDMLRRLSKKGKDRIEFAIPGRIFMEKTDEAATKRVKQVTGENVTVFKKIMADDFVGAPQTILDRIRQLSDLGFNYIIFQPTPALKTLEQMADCLLPLL